MKRSHKNIPKFSREDFAALLHLISPDGSVYTGAEAVFRSLAAGGVKRWLFWCYRKMPPFAGLTEIIYEQVAARRRFLSKLDRFFSGPSLTRNPAGNETCSLSHSGGHI